MKYTDVPEVKKKIMSELEKAINEMLLQLQSHELHKAVRTNDPNLSIGIDFCDAKLTFNVPAHLNSNSEKFEIYCNPVIKIQNS